MVQKRVPSGEGNAQLPGRSSRQRGWDIELNALGRTERAPDLLTQCARLSSSIPASQVYTVQIPT
jgi:hypothetical protein